MVHINKHKFFLIQILKDIYSDYRIGLWHRRTEIESGNIQPTVGQPLRNKELAGYQHAGNGRFRHVCP